MNTKRKGTYEIGVSKVPVPKKCRQALLRLKRAYTYLKHHSEDREMLL